MALLDEAMLAVLSGELRPEWAGNLYRHLMAAFHELADVRRAAEWTEATGRWLAGLPAAVLFTGICRVHRSQVLQLEGAWAQAEREAALVCAPPRSRSPWPPASPRSPAGACEELQRTASTYGSTGLEAGGRPEAALPTLRAACRRWRELDAPFDAARAAALRGRPQLPAGLTGREAEVLALVAAGRTNQEIADALVLSHKTVARHLSNIFTKIEVTSRTQAAAYAFEHGLAAPERG